MPFILETDWDEKLIRGYLYWTPHPWLAASLELFYEDFEREEQFGSPGNLLNLKTYKFKPAVNFIHPAGFKARLEANYVDQKGNFGDPMSGFIPGEDKFWVVNTSVGYRLPERYGIVTLEAKNIFDEHFNFQEEEDSTPTLANDRLIFLKFTLSF